MESIRIIVSGLTQGVGFRPFIYRLARRYGLRGYVANLGGAEVEIFVEGSPEDIRSFIRAMYREKPPPARIDEVKVMHVDSRGYSDFRILPSVRRPEVYSQIPPDFAICDECLREILDENSRFYGYPFNSCAWCGPRFSMIERIPYDRENTAMRDFPLCEECRREYSDPNNIRRFHAQGISCPRCGPRIYVVDGDGEVVCREDPIAYTARLIEEGEIVAVKGIGGFHIATLATDDDVVLKLRERKRRPQKPFALMALDIDIVAKIVEVTPKAEEILRSPQRPIVLLNKREDSPVSKYVAPGLDTYGVMLPYTGIHYLLLGETRDKFLIMTSGNRRNKPICTSFEEAKKQLDDFVDYYLVHDRRIVNRVDDSVVRFTNGTPVFLRRARGYVPEWISLPSMLEGSVIAFGAELQNAGGVGIGDKAILTQYVGDMDDLDNVVFMESALSFLMEAYRVDPSKSIFVADMHPRYTTRRLAEEWSQRYGAELFLVQHHKAHIASVLAEYGVDPLDRIVGIAIDGVGYGEDGLIWGGEVFYGDISNMERVGHLRYQPMPGGDLATKYPVRMLIGILSVFLEDWEIVKILRDRGLFRGLRSDRELDIVLMQSRHSGCMMTSSMGRVLDCVSALLGVCLVRTYEGEPAMKLESFASSGTIMNDIELDVWRRESKWIVDTTGMFEEILSMDGDPRSIAKTVQYELGRALGEVASKYLSLADRQEIYVSGGAAVNNYIIRGIMEGAGATVRINRMVPPGDGGIALGQIYMALSRGCYR